MTTTDPSGITSLTAAERETIINASDADDLVRIWTAQRRHITRLRNNPSFTEVATGHYGTTEWAEFTIPADSWSAASGAKRRVTLTDEQRQAAAERLRAARAS
jgi:hypothetical protein